MLWAVPLLLAFLPPAGSQTSSNMDEGMTVMTRSRGSYVEITCSVYTGSRYTHWYQFREGQVPQRLLYYDSSRSKAVLDSGVSAAKYDAYSGSGKSNKFVVRNVEESDSAVYYCAAWTSDAKKVFGGGTKLVVIDKSSDGDISPKPTIFLPSVAERNRDKAGTYLCLLENFFPDVIKVYWKEKDGNTILKSQEGDTMKTNDTYTKLSWLTVTGVSMDEEHKCIVKHEKNQGRVDQEILFPPVNQIRSTSKPEACMNDENGLLDLQVTSTSAYYTYLLLLLKSAVHGALNTYCLCRRYPDFCYGKST